MAKKWIQQARANMQRKGTVGAFTRWAKRKGYKSVTAKAIQAGLKSRNATIRKRAQFAATMRKLRRK